MKKKPMTPKRGWMLIDSDGDIAIMELYASRQEAFRDKELNERAVPVEICERPKPAKASKRKSGEPDSVCSVCHGTGHPFIEDWDAGQSGYDLRIPCLRCKRPKPRRVPKASYWPAQPPAVLHVRREMQMRGVGSKPRRAAKENRK
jgi:hypothetical protein